MAKKHLFPLLIIISVCLSACLNTTSEAPEVEPESTPIIYLDPPWRAEDFTLIDHNGQPAHISDYQGSLVMLYFGFTFCPDQCPTTLGIWKSVQTELGNKADQVKFIMISVDPERDTPERMQEYMTAFSPNFIGITGSLEDIEGVASDYRISFRKEPLDDTYQVVHTTQTYLIDRDGQIILIFPYNTNKSQILTELQDHLN